MRALTYQGPKNDRVEAVPEPVLEFADDIVLRSRPPRFANRTCTRR